RAALDLIGAETAAANTWQPSCNLKPSPHCFIPNSASSISTFFVTVSQCLLLSLFNPLKVL
ncbi:hypothetical protein, partial [Pseudomonas ceruminis]|uniref:hypothetical protein n=1 Tax=Pseudomonas ceruminis TaxID=2740516 RepID=UPI001CA507F0